MTSVQKRSNTDKNRAQRHTLRFASDIFRDLIVFRRPQHINLHGLCQWCQRTEVWAVCQFISKTVCTEGNVVRQDFGNTGRSQTIAHNNNTDSVSKGGFVNMPPVGYSPVIMAIPVAIPCALLVSFFRKQWIIVFSKLGLNIKECLPPLLLQTLEWNWIFRRGVFQQISASCSSNTFL